MIDIITFPLYIHIKRLNCTFLAGVSLYVLFGAPDQIGKMKHLSEVK